MALHTDGLLVDDGWLRVLGRGSDSGLPSLAEPNELPGNEQPPAGLMVGYDVSADGSRSMGLIRHPSAAPEAPATCATSARCGPDSQYGSSVSTS
jgi:Protein of unknown function DUF2625